MARSGRKRRMKLREPNGRASRVAEPQVPANVVVLAQPHRKGNQSQWCATVFGRFVLDHNLRSEIYQAGEDYASTVRRWRAAKGIPNGYHNPPSTGATPTDESVRRWGERIVAADRAMIRESFKAYLAVRQLLLDENELGMDQDGYAIEGLLALACELGWLADKTHPFALAS